MLLTCSLTARFDAMETDLRDRAQRRDQAADEDEELRREARKKEETWFTERSREWKEREASLLESFRSEVEAVKAEVSSTLLNVRTHLRLINMALGPSSRSRVAKSVGSRAEQARRTHGLDVGARY